MRKTINIATIATMLTMLLEHFTGVSEELGIEPQTMTWIRTIVLAVVLVLNLLSSLKSGQEIKVLKKYK